MSVTVLAQPPAANRAATSGPILRRSSFPASQAVVSSGPRVAREPPIPGARPQRGSPRCTLSGHCRAQLGDEQGAPVADGGVLSYL